MNCKKWAYMYIVISLLWLGSAGFLNYVVDPFGMFQHNNALNTLSDDYDERLQKSVYLKFKSTKDYDSILFGSSRATYYNQTHFNGINLFNYAFSGGVPIEYDHYLEYAKHINKKPFKYIILGLDFSAFSKYSDRIKEKFKAPGNKISFFIKHYFSLNVVGLSLTNIKRSFLQEAGSRSYNRKNIAFVDKVDEKTAERVAKKDGATHYNHFNKIDDKYIKILNQLKIKNSKSKFIVFTPPVSEPFLNKIYSDKKLRNFYFKWMRTLVTVFDKVYFFTAESEFSEKYTKLCMDGSHYYPEVGDIIASILFGNKSIDKYGYIINSKNVESIIKRIKLNYSIKSSQN